jgi:branched-chain amino acid transport system ATP-binding protein
MLEVEGLETSYGDSQVLFGVDLDLGAGEVVALLGRNGMGKTTTVLSIFGLLKPKAGRVRFEGRDLTGKPPFVIAQQGLGLVPEGRQVFPTLTVEENLIATSASRFGAPRWTLGAIYDLFPRLAERRDNLGNQLSGGEQQMLAIGRALMTNPKLIVFDEATEGLAPLIRAAIWSCLARLKAEGLAILVIDKNVDALVRLADRHVVLEKGRVAWRGTSAELAVDPSVRDRYLHIGGGEPATARLTNAPTTHTNASVTRLAPPSIKENSPMPLMTPGIMPANQGIDNISWNILGQTYVPKQVSDSSFSWHATFPPGTFVPPHIHPTQDEFIYMLEGQFEMWFDGRTDIAKAGDLIRMPMGIPHGIFNKSDRIVKCLFWVSPTRRLYDLFWAIHNMAEQTPAEVVALSAKHEVDFLPPPEVPK